MRRTYLKRKTNRRRKSIRNRETAEREKRLRTLVERYQFFRRRGYSPNKSHELAVRSIEVERELKNGRRG
jgi:hypothetical protein